MGLFYKLVICDVNERINRRLARGVFRRPSNQPFPSLPGTKLHVAALMEDDDLQSPFAVVREYEHMEHSLGPSGKTDLGAYYMRLGPEKLVWGYEWLGNVFIANNSNETCEALRNHGWEDISDE